LGYSDIISMAVVTLPSIEGEINESNKNFEEGSLT
jgi:hypothetical protein